VPKYRKHVVDVYAFQLTKESIPDSALWPQWLRDALDDRTIIRGSVSRDLFENTPDGEKYIRVNHWAIRGIDNHVHIMDPEEFSTTYMEVPDDR
jgi:hypothetical protein